MFLYVELWKPRPEWYALSKEEQVKYILPVETELEMDSNWFLNSLDKVFDRWIDKFGFKPRILMTKLGTRIARGNIIITADNMTLIQDLLEDFLNDIWFSLHKEG